MSLISTATYDQLEVMVKSAVSTGFHDHTTGRHHVPRPLLEKLQGLSQKYSLALKAYRDDKARGKDLRKRRDEVSTRLARHVRNIHFMFHRLFGMGDVKRLDMTLFGIPDTSMREAAHRIDIWRHQADLIIRGFHERQTQAHQPLPPYLMSPAIIELLAGHKALADAVAAELHTLQTGSQQRHQHLQTLRAQLVHQMTWLHKHLEVSLFEHERPIRFQIMKNYGIPVSKKRRLAQPKDIAPKPGPSPAASETAKKPEPDAPAAKKIEPAEAIIKPMLSKRPDMPTIEKGHSPTASSQPSAVTSAKGPTIERAAAPPAHKTRVANDPGPPRHNLKISAREEFVEVSDEKWEQLMSDDPDELDAYQENHLPKKATPKNTTKKKKGIAKGQRKPISKKEKEKKKANRKMARKSRRGK